MGKSAETTTPNEDKHSIPWTGIIAWPFVILILYALSVGPFMMMIDKGRISPNTEAFLEKFYKPLDWAYSDTLLHKPIGMYLHLWSKRFDRDGDQK
jgi:hypothetical protein